MSGLSLGLSMGLSKNGTPAAVVPQGLTFDPANKSADFTLSSGNLTAQRTANATASANAKATGAKTTGKWHVEFTVTQYAGGSLVLGVALAAYSNTTGTGGAGSGTVKNTGGIVADGSSFGLAGDAFTTGDIVAVELDLTTSPANLWFQKLGGAAGRVGPYQIAIGAGLLPLVGCEGGAAGLGSSATINATPSITPTSGFLLWTP